MGILHRALSVALCVALWATVALAQDTADDLERWDAFAGTVADAIEQETTSEQVLVAMRKRVATFRDSFDESRSANADRIAVLRQQLTALGPEPTEEGATPEPVDVAARRTELNQRLATLMAPVQKAEAEFVRANDLVSQIDQTLRERQAREILSNNPSPLNPAYWRGAYDDLARGARTLWGQTPSRDTAMSDLGSSDRLPVTALLTLLAVVLIVRGRYWSRMIVESLRKLGGRGTGVWSFFASLLRIIFPFAGLLLLARAAQTSELFGPDIQNMLLFLAALGGVMLGVRWISEQVFSRDEDEALVGLDSGHRTEVRFYVNVITFLIIITELIVLVLDAGSGSAVSEAILTFGFLVLSSLALLRIGMLLRGYADPEPEEDGAGEMRSFTFRRVVRTFGTGAVIIGGLSPILMAAGFYNFASALLVPYAETMSMLGLVMVLQRFAADVYGAITGLGERAREALLPALVGFILLVVISPFIALAWGARVTDLTELWAAINRGFAIGETRVSPSDFLTFALIFVIGYGLTRLVQSSLRASVLPKTKLDTGAQNAIVSGLGYVGIFLAGLAAITGAGIDLSSLAIVAGALSVGIGFGLQNIVSNFVSGIILLIERPISEGDWIEVGSGQMGYVRDISVRSTRIETFDRTDVIVPNADLVSGLVTNYTRGNTVGRVIVPIGVAYGTDTKRVDAILREIAEAQPMVLQNPPPNVVFMRFGADALEFEIRCFLRDVNWMISIKNDINHAIAARFSEEGIEIPFAQRDLWLRNPDALRNTETPQGGGST